MEEWCILPNNLIKELGKEDNIVLHSLSLFCACTTQELIDVLNIRNKSSYFGYKRWAMVDWKKTRRISEPCTKLKKIQDNIKQRLACIPTSLASTGWKPWDSAEKNADMHKFNPYLITIDIKNAYPSINTKRVYKCLEWSITKALDIRCPLLERPEEKELFIRALTHLCVSKNELPQWASTSTQIQNIVMRGFDTGIEKIIPELVWSHIIYSRYADDITVSFPHFTTMSVLKEKMWKYIKQFKQKDENIILIEHIENIIKEFSKDTFIITDKFELTYLQGEIDSIKEIIKTSWLQQTELFKQIGRIDQYKKQIKYSDRRITDISDRIIEIIWDKWRKINMRKFHTWTPQSNTDREINGMSFDHTWQRWLNTKKKSQYKRLLNDLIVLSFDELYKNSHYKEKFKIEDYDYSSLSVTKIKNTIKGIYWRLKQIYWTGKIPSELFKMIQDAKEKWENYWERERRNPKLNSDTDISQAIKEGKLKRRNNIVDQEIILDSDLPFPEHEDLAF